MGDIFADLRSGVQFPQVVMNQGPMPGSGGLPRPLHDTVDGRINYNSSLLGNLEPYAYGEPGYLSSQTAYLNIPHKIQKFVPIVYLPEAKPGATDFFDLPHPVDDGDLVFTLRLDRNSLFCTGLKHGDSRRISSGTAVDPLINLATVNYILSGVQLGISKPRPGGGPADPASAMGPGNLWTELLFNLDRHRFGKHVGMNGRDYARDPLLLSDIIHIVRHCIRPLGIARGSEKQGGQNEATLSPATWPVGFVISVTLDGKESNVMNLWHNSNLSAGDDLVLGLKLMPLRPYTLNHYYKSIKRHNWFFHGESAGAKQRYVWQLVPILANLEAPTKEEGDMMEARLGVIDEDFRKLSPYPGKSPAARRAVCETVDRNKPWQELGYWHIGRSQIMTRQYGVEEYWHNDLANSLRTNHLDITLQPFFTLPPPRRSRNKPQPVISSSLFGLGDDSDRGGKRGRSGTLADLWKPSLGLERLSGVPQPAPRQALAGQEGEGGWEEGLGLLGGTSSGASRQQVVSEGLPVSSGVIDLLSGEGLSGGVAVEDTLVFHDDDEPGPQQQPSAASESRPAAAGAKKGGGTGRKRTGGGGGQAAAASVVGGSLLKADGSSEASMVSML